MRFWVAFSLAVMIFFLHFPGLRLFMGPKNLS